MCTVANDEQDKQPPSPASTSQPVITTTSTAASAAASATAVTPAEPEPVRADGSDKYYGMENVNILPISSLAITDIFFSLATLGR